MIALAVYGTLRRGERNAGLIEGARFLGAGRVRGWLYDMPANAERAYGYPALVPTDDGSEVMVEILDLVDPAVLASVDALEAFDPSDVAGSEYRREEIVVREGPVDRAWVYFYNGPLDALGPRIVDGDWVAHRGRPG